jgi:hypothetical protein
MSGRGLERIWGFRVSTEQDKDFRSPGRRGACHVFRFPEILAKVNYFVIKNDVKDLNLLKIRDSSRCSE